MKTLKLFTWLLIISLLMPSNMMKAMQPDDNTNAQITEKQEEKKSAKSTTTEKLATAAKWTVSIGSALALILGIVIVPTVQEGDRMTQKIMNAKSIYELEALEKGTKNQAIIKVNSLQDLIDSQKRALRLGI